MSLDYLKPQTISLPVSDGYALLDGSKVYTGTIDLDSNNIVNINTLAVDGYFVHNSSVFVSVIDISSDYYVSGSEYIIAVDTTSAVTVFLPKASSANGLVLVVKDATGNAVAQNITIACADWNDTIDGGSSVTIATSWESRTVVSDGYQWLGI